MLFPLGRVVATPGALKLLEESQVDPSLLLNRHVSGDWGDLCEEDVAQNNQAVSGEGRVMSSYKVGNNGTIWVITEWDRSATTLLLPEEY